MTDELKDGELSEFRRIADQWACQKLHEKYWYAEAVRDVDQVCSVFTPDARYGSAVGIEEIRKTVEGYMRGMDGSVLENYHIIPIVVDLEVTGATAKGEVRGVAFIRVSRPDGTESILGMGIAYLDEFVRTEEGWRISAMRGIESGFAAPHDTTWQFAAENVTVPFMHE
jgi:hypothetical protein